MTHETQIKRKHRNALRQKATLVQTTIIAVVVLAFSLAIIFFNAYRLNSQVESRITSIATLAETSLASAVWQVDHASARDFINAVLQDESVVFAQVITGRETMAAKSQTAYAGKPFSFFQDERGFQTRTVEIRKYGDWIGTFNMAVSTEGIHHDIIINAAGTLALALILILAISQTTLYFSRKRLFDPLKRLEESATAIANGDLNAPIDTTLPGELGSLARATDDMRESVRHLIKDLKKANTRLEDHKNSLENTVRERTDELKRKNVTLNQALEDVQNTKQAAEVANLAKSRFLASMSHEIRTPMNAILGMADILWETDLSTDQSRYVQVFRSAGESLLEILDDILDLSKIEAGHMNLEATGFSLTRTLDKACSVIEAEAAEKRLDFSYSIAPSVPDKLIGDPTRLKQVLLNLLGNAIKFTQEGEVRLSVGLAPGSDDATVVEFSVQDTGPGIPPDKLDTIFDSFTQADSSTTREFGGTGLGLAISKQLVRMMQGRIWVESSLGIGSTFHFTARLDAAPTDVPIASLSKRATSVDMTPTLPPLNILMLEDSKYNAFVIQTYLKNTPCNLTVTTNGIEGVDAYKKGGFDCILMDIQMPVMDGYEATRAIRAWEEDTGLHRTPIIAMTAYALIGDADRCLDAGADFHLAKPVKKSALFDIINQLTARTTTQSTPFGTPAFAELKQSIIQAFTALEDADIEALKSIANTLASKGGELSMDAVAGYGNALKEAVEDDANPERIRQLLTILSEYIERLDAV
ncbi:ATP-binding protein [Pseudodesulfovibrio sp.]|nr:ATP-binding protein [Pseudodesulfovibrio sp.]